MLGHEYHKCHDIDEWDSYPKEGLDYQPDYRNETYYSIYTQEEIDEVYKDAKSTGNFDVRHLFHMDDSWIDWAEELLTFKIIEVVENMKTILFEGYPLIDEDDDLQHLARLHCTYFQNPLIGSLLGAILLKDNTVDNVLENLQNRYEDEDEDDDDGYDGYREFLENVVKESFRDKLSEELESKESARLIKI